MKKVISLTVAISSGLFLVGCASPGLKEFTAQNGDTIRIIDTGVDTAGGPRMKVVQVLKSDGTVVDSSMASGQGTFQGATHLGMTAPITAAIAGHYQKAAAGVLRPTQYNNTESTVVQGGDNLSQGGESISMGGSAYGGAGGHGGNSASTSQGGQGGYGTGGNSTATVQNDDSTHTTTNRYNTSTVNNPVSISAKNGSNASVISGNRNSVEQAGVQGGTNTHIKQ